MYVITGATGNTGKLIAEILLSKEQKVRVVGRDKSKLKPLVDKGAEAVIADLTDVPALTRALTGAKAAYLLLPPKLDTENLRAYQNLVGEAQATAVRNSGIKYIVNLSSMGAQHPVGVGPVCGLFDQEQRLSKLEGVNILHLRPGYFMENTLGQAQLIKQMGIMGSPVMGKIKFGMIATRDIAAFAAERLLKLDFSGKSVRELQGQRDVSYDEIARVFGKAIGKPDLKYVQFSLIDSVNAMIGMGLSSDIAHSFVELGLALNTGHIAYIEPRSAANTTPTSIEEFAKTFTAVYNAS